MFDCGICTIVLARSNEKSNQLFSVVSCLGTNFAVKQIKIQMTTTSDIKYFLTNRATVSLVRTVFYRVREIFIPN
jgi:hypothetical protein